MDSFKIGTWFSYKKPKWETNLEWCSDDIIKQTGLSRERLIKALEVLYEHKIID
jgi:hypothetical protein